MFFFIHSHCVTYKLWYSFKSSRYQFQWLMILYKFFEISYFYKLIWQFKLYILVEYYDDHDVTYILLFRQIYFTIILQLPNFKNVLWTTFWYFWSFFPHCALLTGALLVWSHLQKLVESSHWVYFFAISYFHAIYRTTYFVHPKMNFAKFFVRPINYGIFMKRQMWPF